MTDIRDWSTNPASNNSSPPVGAPEGQTAGSINNVLREMMAYTVQEAQANRVKTLGSVAGTNTITASMTPALGGYVGGMTLIFTPAATNTGDTTINVNGLGAISITDASGSALLGGEILISKPVMLLVTSAATSAVIVNPNPAVGTFATTLSGCVTASGTLNFSKTGKIVSIWAEADISGTLSGTGACVINAVPDALMPGTSGVTKQFFRSIPCVAIQGGLTVFAFASRGGNNQIDVFSTNTTSGGGNNSVGFSNLAAAGTAGLPQGFSLTYSVR